jgi:uncharacterized membrane protein
MQKSNSEYVRRRRSPQALRYFLEGGAVLLIAILGSAVLALHLTRPPIAYGQDRPNLGITVQGRVENILEESEIQDDTGLFIVYQKLDLRILSPGQYRDELMTIDYNGMGPTREAVRFRQGARALVMITDVPEMEGMEARTLYQVADHVRLWPLGLVAALFAVITLTIGRWRGVRAILGLVLSGLVVGGFIMPQILANRDPVLITMIGTSLLLAVTLYLIQGWNVIGHTALFSMLASLGVTAALALLATRITYLTGFGSEETLFLQALGVGVQMRGLLLAGMILGAAGVLDDVIIAQAVTVFELRAADRTMAPLALYRSGMRIGVTHLASMINTLALAYASTALPLLILFYLFPEPVHLTINRELLAEEIIRTLVGSMGLMLAVPLTTALSAWVAPQFDGAVSKREP